MRSTIAMQRALSVLGDYPGIKLAKRLRTGQSTISMALTGARPSYQLRIRIAKVLGLPQEQLWPDTITTEARSRQE